MLHIAGFVETQAFNAGWNSLLALGPRNDADDLRARIEGQLAGDGADGSGSPQDDDSLAGDEVADLVQSHVRGRRRNEVRGCELGSHCRRGREEC